MVILLFFHIKNIKIKNRVWEMDDAEDAHASHPVYKRTRCASARKSDKVRRFLARFLSALADSLVEYYSGCHRSVQAVDFAILRDGENTVRKVLGEAMYAFAFRAYHKGNISR